MIETKEINKSRLRPRRETISAKKKTPLALYAKKGASPEWVCGALQYERKYDRKKERKKETKQN
jgi:hypothetical protein